MKRKKGIVIGLIIVSVIGLFLLTACNMDSPYIDSIREQINTDLGLADENTIPTYTVTYDGNGHTGGLVPVDENSYIEGNIVTVLSPGDIEKTGHTFLNWNTQQDGSGTSYSSDMTFSMGTSDITLFAQWDVNSYTVTYLSNGATNGTVPSSSESHDYGEEVSVLENTGILQNVPTAGTAEAYNFGGWNTKADGSGTNYTVGSTFEMDAEDLVLYSKWVPFQLRDKGPAGGWIFYDKGSFTDNWRYLEAAPANQSSSYWATDLGSISTSDAIGEGKQNTDNIKNNDGITTSAADRCVAYSPDYNGTTYADWFLPSRSELYKLYQNLFSGTDENSDAFTPVLSGSYKYWSSSQHATTSSWAWTFETYTPGAVYSAKNYQYSVRAVRQF